jgi:hypothetical protein
MSSRDRDTVRGWRLWRAVASSGVELAGNGNGLEQAGIRLALMVGPRRALAALAVVRRALAGRWAEWLAMVLLAVGNFVMWSFFIVLGILVFGAMLDATLESIFGLDLVSEGGGPVRTP